MVMKRKILFIGINQRYMNATNSLLPAVIQRVGDVFFYGPGFVGKNTLDQGVERYIEKIGGVDFIIITAQCLIKFDINRFEKYLIRYTAVFNSGIITTLFLDDVRRFCKNNQKKVICGISEVDPHVTPQSTLDALLEHSEYFMGWGNGFLNAKGDMEAVAEEGYIQKKLKKGFELGLMDEFVDKHFSRVINLGHFVSDSEFYWGNLSARKYDVAVPGSRYERRQKTIEKIKQMHNVSLANNSYKYYFKIADRLHLNPYSNFYCVNLYNLFFQQELSNSKACITEGGANNHPVRKFFEISAAGSLMICWPSVGFEMLGFRDGVNCIYIKSINEIIKIIEMIKDNIEHFQPIASEGRKLVLTKHSVSARASQLSQVLEKINQGNYNGSFWKDGDFII